MKNTFLLTVLLMMTLFLGACSKMGSKIQMPEDSSHAGLDGSGGNGPNGYTPGDPNIGAGNGEKVVGVGALSVPTADGVVARIRNALNIQPTAGNFARALAQVKGNLPKVPDPTKATGFDQAQLLVYAACSDLTTGGNNSLMTTRYQVQAGQTIAQNQARLVAAGVAMIDSYTAKIASEGPAAAQVSASFTEILTKLQAAQGNTSTIAFMSVCIAANTAGSALLGF